jgi:hypothetical protein
MRIINKRLSIVYGKIFLVALFSFFYSCKKNDGHLNREVRAVIVHSSGTTVTINASWPDARLGHDLLFLQTTYGEGNSNFARINWTVPYVTAPGTFTNQYRCTYSAHVNLGPYYENTVGWVKNPGSVTITSVSNEFIEGTFTATCKTHMMATDSVTITGSFKGQLD